MIGVMVGGERATGWIEGMGFWQEQLLGIGMILAYYILMEGVFGLTIGKLITGTRVVDERGGPPSVRQAVLRSLARLLPFEAFSVLLSQDGAARGWHDTLPRTRVVLRRGLRGAARRRAWLPSGLSRRPVPTRAGRCPAAGDTPRTR